MYEAVAEFLSRYLDGFSTADGVTAIASVLAVVISVIAYHHTRKSSHSQKREEFRNVLCRLVDYRLEFNENWTKIIDETARNTYSSTTNYRRQILLSAAEALAKELGDDVSVAEYLLLGLEHYMDSDFSEARAFYEKAVKAKGPPDDLTRCTAYRHLAGSYFWQGKDGPLDKARGLFKKTIDMQILRSDPYSLQCASLTARMLGGLEFQVGNYDLVPAAYEEAIGIAERIPKWHTGHDIELRNAANDLLFFAHQGFDKQEAKSLERASGFYRRALEAQRSLPEEDDNTWDLRGRTYLSWAQNEAVAGNNSGALRYIDEAAACFGRLREAFPMKPQRAADLTQFRSKIVARSVAS